MTEKDLCPSFHGGSAGFRNAVYYCVLKLGHDGNHKDQLNREWENWGVRDADRD